MRSERHAPGATGSRFMTVYDDSLAVSRTNWDNACR